MCAVLFVVLLRVAIDCFCDVGCVLIVVVVCCVLFVVVSCLLVCLVCCSLYVVCWWLNAVSFCLLCVVRRCSWLFAGCCTLECRCLCVKRSLLLFVSYFVVVVGCSCALWLFAGVCWFVACCWLLSRIACRLPIDAWCLLVVVV